MNEIVRFIEWTLFATINVNLFAMQVSGIFFGNKIKLWYSK